MITQEELKRIIHYNPETGVFTRLIAYARGMSVGSILGSPDKDGYLRIHIYGKTYKSHRLAFLYMTGSIPKNEIDHIDRIKSNNKWSNLRSASRKENAANQNKFKTNTSGYIGVRFDKKRHNSPKPWKVTIEVNGKKIHLGYYTTAKEGAIVFDLEAIKYRGVFANTNFSRSNYE